MEKLKVAIVGTGFIGRQHIEAVRRVPNTELVAICENNPVQAKKIANVYGISEYFSDIDELIKQHPDLNVIHNCTPSSFHFCINKKVIEAGINVYCEKPLTNTVEESEELVNLLKEKQSLAGVNFNYRHNLMALEMKELVRQQKIGKPWFVQAEYLQDWLLRQTDFDWRVDEKIGGKSRAIADIGSHCFDTLQFILGEKIVKLEAKLFKKFDNRIKDGKEVPVTNEDAAIIQVEFESGLCGLIRVSQVTAGKKNDLRILIEGDEQSLEWAQERPDRLRIGNRDRGNEELYADAKYLDGEAAQKAILPNGHVVGWADAFKDGISDFYSAVQGDKNANYVSFAEASYIMKLVNACIESDQKAKAIEI